MDHDFLKTLKALAGVVIFLSLFLSGDVELNPGPKYDRLTTRDLRAVQAALWKGRSNWYNIGIQLGILVEELEVIRKRHLNNADECVTDLLTHWLRNTTPQPTWSSIVKALRSPTVDLSHLAHEIEIDILPVNSSQATTVQEPQSPMEMAVIVPQKKFKNISQFDGLSDEQKEELELLLTMETDDIKTRFNVLRNKFFKSLDTQLCQKPLLVKDLLRHLKGLTQLKTMKIPSTLVNQSQLQDIDDVEAIKDMIESVSTFFDFHPLEYMIELDGLDEDKEQLLKYKEDFEHYMKRRIFECPPEIEAACIRNNTELRVKLETDFMKLSDLKQLQCRLSLILEISVHVLRLCSFKEGCIELIFLIPDDIKEVIFPLSTEQEEYLAEQDVIRLSCEGYHLHVQRVCDDGEHLRKIKEELVQARESFELEMSQKDSELHALKTDLAKCEESFKQAMQQKDNELHVLKSEMAKHEELAMSQKDSELHALKTDLPKREESFKQEMQQKDNELHALISEMVKRKATGYKPLSPTLEHIPSGCFQVFPVDKNCELSTLIVKLNLAYRVGGVYYEFARNEEYVTEDTGVILMDKLSKTLFTGERAKMMVGLPAKGLLRKPNLKGHRVFIQSKGIGRRPLIKGTSILYEINPPYPIDSSSDQDLIPVDPKHFKKLKVKKVCQLQKFVEDDCGLTYVRGCAFYEFSHKTEDIDKDKEVILISKATGDMFTGPGAMSMIPGAPGRDITRPDLPDWRVFVQSNYFGARHLDAGTLVLYEKPMINEDKFLSSKKRTRNEEFELVKDLQRIEEGRFTIYAVDKNCELSSMIVKHNLTYRIGGVYYEFARNEEDVSEDKGVILMDKLSKTLYTGENAKTMIGLPAEGRIRKPNLKDYHVFIQSKGIGRRPLIKGTSILYEANPLCKDVDSNSDQDFKPVNPKRFKKLKVEKVCQLQKFVEDDCGLTYVRGCAFHEFSHKSEDIDKDKEVILMSKATGDMFTGPGAMSMIPGAPGIGVTRPDLPEWRVFVQSKYLGARHLDAGTLVLYEEPMINEDKFSPDNYYDVLEVDNDCIIEDFVVKQVGEYEPSRVLFEFTNKAEEITEDKKVVIMNKKTKEIFTGPKVLEMVGAPCAPGKQVNNPHLKEYRVFVQSAGRGTRFLKAGTYLLYEKNI